MISLDYVSTFELGTFSANMPHEEVCIAPPSDVYRKVGTHWTWSWGPVESKLPSPGAKRWPHLEDTAYSRPRSGSLKTPPKQVRAVESGGRDEMRWSQGEGRSDSAKWENGRGKCARVKEVRSEREETIKVRWQR
jgi:hypothetical protein